LLLTALSSREQHNKVSKSSNFNGIKSMSKSTIQKILASLALLIAGSAALAFGVAQLRREPPNSSQTSTASAISPRPSEVQDLGATRFATAQVKTDIADSAISPNLSSGAKTPVFDIARIEAGGDAVIAGSAAPGASVELLRDGEVEDRVIADRSGQFVMTPARLPAGDYQLTLRSTQTDGKQATSQQTVAFSLQPNSKPQTTVAMLTPDRVTGDNTVSYRGLPPLTSLLAETGAPHRGNHRHIGHRYHASHEQRHHVVFAAHRAIFSRVAQTPLPPQTPGPCADTSASMAQFLCFFGFR
jgi:hypothetical protein